MRLPISKIHLRSPHLSSHYSIHLFSLAKCKEIEAVEFLDNWVKQVSGVLGFSLPTL